MPAIVAFWLQRLPVSCWIQMTGLIGAGPACLDSCPRLPHARAGFGVREKQRFYGLEDAQTHVAAKFTAAGEQRCTHPMPFHCDLILDRTWPPPKQFPSACLGRHGLPSQKKTKKLVDSSARSTYVSPRNIQVLVSMPAHKTFKIKKTLAKKARQNRQIPQWIRLRTDNKIRYNAKRRNWRRTKLGL